MSESLPVEGTFRLDGLLEVRIDDVDGIRGKLEEWARQARREFGLHFHVQIEGSGLSVMPDAEVLDAEELSVSVEESVRSALQALVEILPEAARPNVMSTIRSIKFGRNEEVQTLYAVDAAGTVELQSRTQAAETAARPRKLTTREKLETGAFVAIAILLVFLISSIFIDYRALLRNTLLELRPVNVEAIEVSAGPFAEFVDVANATEGKFRGKIALKITAKERLAGFLQALEKDPVPDGISWKDKLAVEALARGYLHVEFYDDEGELVKHKELRVPVNLLTADDPLKIELPRDRVARIRLTY